MYLSRYIACPVTFCSCILKLVNMNVKHSGGVDVQWLEWSSHLTSRIVNPLRIVNPTKWSNTLKQIVDKLIEFDHFVGLPLRGLSKYFLSVTKCEWDFQKVIYCGMFRKIYFLQNNFLDFRKVEMKLLFIIHSSTHIKKYGQKLHFTLFYCCRFQSWSNFYWIQRNMTNFQAFAILAYFGNKSRVII